MWLAYKKTSTIWFRLTSGVLLLFLSLGCSLFAKKEAKPLTEREAVFEKGNALFIAEEYEKALPFFIKITRQAPELTNNNKNLNDTLYEKSLWNLSVVFEKTGSPEKALLTLRELEKVNPICFSNFKIQLAKMKNYFRVSSEYQAVELRKQMDADQPFLTYDLNEIYSDLNTTMTLNYDRLILEELQYMSEIQKYYVYVMESDHDPINARATDLLIEFSDRTYSLLSNQALSPDFRRKIAESLLDYLRQFDRYKIDDLNLNLQTISKFSIYSEKKQKLITDWLHR